MGGLKALWADMVAVARGAFNALLSFFAGIWGEIKTAFAGGIGGVSALIVNWSPLGLIYKAFAGVMRFFNIELPGSLTSAVRALWGKIRQAFAGGIGGVSALIVNWSPLGLFYKAFAGALGGFGVGLPEAFRRFGVGILSSLYQGLLGGATTVMGFRWVMAADQGRLRQRHQRRQRLIINWSRWACSIRPLPASALLRRRSAR